MHAKDFRRKAWLALSGKWGTFVVIVLVAGLIVDACIGSVSFARSNPIVAAICAAVGFVVGALVGGPLSLGLAACFLKLMRGQSVEIGNVFDGFKNFAKAFLLYLLNVVFVFLWSLLLIIPGIIKAYSYSMSTYILADNPETEANDARKKSIEIMRGHKWRLFCLDLSFIGWYILCILTLGILTLWVAPYHNAARAEFYRNLTAEPDGVADVSSEEFIQHTADGNNGGGEPPLNADDL